MINTSSTHAGKPSASKYLALHLRFEIDMVAHSLCEYGGGDKEREELEEYRRIHFPALTVLKETGKYVFLLLVYLLSTFMTGVFI